MPKKIVKKKKSKPVNVHETAFRKLYEGGKSKPNIYSCRECGHSLELHDHRGCRVERILTGEKCDCSRRV